MRELLFGSSTAADCRCETAIEGERLVVTAEDCPGGGDLAASADCRATVVDSLSSTGVETIVTEQAGQERVYVGRAAAVLIAAGRFATRVASLQGRLA